MKNGILAIDKPEGISSARVVSRVKKTLGAKKVGHTGTLDPFATGVLLCAINKGTKISSYFLGGTKKYKTRIHLGIETDTYDSTGKIQSEISFEGVQALDEEKIRETVASFKGPQDQIPPIYSALKHQGQPLYKLARQGKKITKPARPIEIFDIHIDTIELPYVDIEVACSTGTYIRSLGYDIGKKLGCGAHLSTLCRTQSSAFRIEDAISLDAFEQLDKPSAEQKIIPLSRCLDFMPKVVVGEDLVKKIKHGQQLFIEEVGAFGNDLKQQICVTDKNNEALAIIQQDETLDQYNYSCVFIA